MAELSKDLLRALRADIDAALVDVAKRHGLKSLQAGNCSYNSGGGSFTFKLNGVVEGGLDKEASAYEARRRYDPTLPPLGAAFEYGGRTYTVAGANRGTRLFADRDDGKRFVFPRDVVARLTGSEPKLTIVPTPPRS